MDDPIGWTRPLDAVEVRPLHPARNDAHGERARQRKCMPSGRTRIHRHGGTQRSQAPGRPERAAPDDRDRTLARIKRSAEDDLRARGAAAIAEKWSGKDGNQPRSVSSGRRREPGRHLRCVCRRIPQQRSHAGMGSADRCDATRRTCKRVAAAKATTPYFFFLRFVFFAVFFAADLVFDLRFLAMECPPSCD